MDTDGTVREAAIKRRFLLIFAAPLLLFPLLSLAMEHWLGPGPERRYHASLLWTIAIPAACVACVILNCAITIYYEGRLRREARSKGIGAAEAAHQAFLSGRGTRGFLAVYAFIATNWAGWLWGAVFYGVYVLSLAEVMIRWRRYEKAAREAQSA